MKTRRTHIHLYFAPELKIYHLYYLMESHEAFDIANPSCTRDTCHI